MLGWDDRIVLMEFIGRTYEIVDKAKNVNISAHRNTFISGKKPRYVTACGKFPRGIKLIMQVIFFLPMNLPKAVIKIRNKTVVQY